MPPQISELVSEDRCHLNGMAMQNGKPKFASAFNQGNAHQSWRENLLTSGVIYDVETSEVVCQGLAMPHSPKIYNNNLYVLQSATGELTQIDLSSGKKNTVAHIGGFLRGMTLVGDYLFISRSKPSSAGFAILRHYTPQVPLDTGRLLIFQLPKCFQSY